MQRILILASSTIILSGCSFLSNSAYSDADFQAHPQTSSYSHSACATTHCVPGSTYAVGHTSEHHGHQSAYTAQYGHSEYASSAPQAPAEYAYGSQVQNYGGQAQTHYGHSQPVPQLRGAYGPQRRQAYKYGNLGGVAYDVGTDAYGLQGRMGYQTASYFGAEVEGSFGVIKDKETVGALELKSGVDYSVGAFVRGVLPLGEKMNVFGRAGYHATEVEGSLTDGTSAVAGSVSTDGFAYGAGAEYALNPRDSLRLDYTRYDLGPAETDSVSIAYARKF